MRWSSYHLSGGAITAPEMDGFFLHHSALGEHRGQWEWQCPWCEHSVVFGARDRGVAEGAARGHVLSRHGIKLWSDVMGALEVLRSGSGRD